MSEELNDPMLLRIAEPEGFKGWHKTVVSGTVSIDGMGVFTGEHYAIHDEDCSVVCMLGPVEEGPGNDPGIARRNGLLFLMAPMITAGVREMLAASKRNDPAAR